MALDCSEMTVAEFAAARPCSTRVFYRYRIDFSSGKSVNLVEACRAAGVVVEALLAEVEEEEAHGVEDPSWVTRPLSELVEHIETAFHAVERREMEEITELLRTLPVQPNLQALREAFGKLHEDLREHMAKEETVLFPWIRSGRGELARMPIQVMVMEHEETLRLLDRVRDLMQSLVQTRATPAVTRTAAALAELDLHIREHMHLENNILFPRALRGEEQSGAGD